MENPFQIATSTCCTSGKFPAKQYSVNGERRSFALLRPIVDTTAQNKVRDAIVEAYLAYEAQAADLDHK